MTRHSYIPQIFLAMTKILKGFGALLFLAFITLFAYANLRQPSIIEEVEPVHLKIFQLNRTATQSELQTISATLTKLPGVTAASFGSDAETFSVTFNPKVCKVDQVLAAAQINESLSASEKTFPPRPACPVPPLYGLKHDVLKALRIH